ncbi:MAG: hypothetical protein CMK00_03155 [Planctomycetes bacterium]|jgi:hypothetical protein|nr:hypothetical protein [Planctomycetota bacterium]HJO27321.1 hypothetical protein [Planctomycetota bacterium]
MDSLGELGSLVGHGLARIVNCDSAELFPGDGQLKGCHCFLGGQLGLNGEKCFLGGVLNDIPRIGPAETLASPGMWPRPDALT